MQITSWEIRNKFIEFFKTKWHAIIPSASLVPENDPTVLFNIAWMQPLVPYLLWEKHPSWTRLADYQKCIRTNDINEVWDNRHLTFFEMLWNWSLWDYFKNESITWSYELLTDKKWFGIDPSHLCVTVFEGDDSTPKDEEAANIWRSLWVPDSRICYLWAKDNWWKAWPTWPCGPDTEIFYYVWDNEPSLNSNVINDEENWMEIWNNVFMQYNRLENGNLVNLPAKNVDTWMWLERITTTLNKKKTVYETDIFQDVLETIKSFVWEKNYIDKSAKIIADHIRAGTHMIADGVIPKNVDQWYILRRLLRRAIREFYKMWYEEKIISKIAQIYINKFEDIYETVKNNSAKIIDELDKEEERFSKTLKDWIKEFDKLLNWFQIAFERTWKKVSVISGEKAFRLYDTYWFPIEMTLEFAGEKWLEVDEKWFHEAFLKHQELSRTASEWKFKWWLASSWEIETAYHTTTHIMLAWLRKILWNHVFQAWSNITSERIRFDFTHGQKVTAEELQQVENFVNEVIGKNCDMILTEMKKTDALQSWIVGSFWEKYPDMVKIYTLKDTQWNIYSQELCGWPHKENTADMGIFKIQKEEASSSWVRRIKAVLIK
jgi:alanyl-tRNA synthetase